jgi:hypothetical protein
MSVVEFTALALATWRVSVALVEEDGPFEVLAKLRERAGVRYDEESWPYGENALAKMLTCLWCLSPWVGTLWLAFWLAAPGLAFCAALPFAWSAVAVIVHGRGVRYRRRS